MRVQTRLPDAGSARETEGREDSRDLLYLPQEFYKRDCRKKEYKEGIRFVLLTISTKDTAEKKDNIALSSIFFTARQEERQKRGTVLLYE